MSILKIGVLGCANVACNHVIPAILSLKDKYELVGVASRSKEKADYFAKSFGCKSYYGYNSILEDRGIDALYIPLPTGLHKEWIGKSIQAGKHVYAEKSIAFSVENVENMINSAKSNRLALMEGYMFQYHDQHQIVKKMLSNGEIGAIRHVKASFGFPPLDKDNFRYKAQIGGGALYDVGGYVWRALNFLFGNIFDVKASNIYVNDEGTSIYGSAFAVSTNGISGEISYGFDNYYQCNYEIWGSTGRIFCPKAFTPKEHEITKILLEKQNEKNVIECLPCNHFKKSMEEFHRICEDENSRFCHFSDILHQIEGLQKMKMLNKE